MFDSWAEFFNYIDMSDISLTILLLIFMGLGYAVGYGNGRMNPITDKEIRKNKESEIDIKF